MPRDDLHHSMLNATSCVPAPNSATAAAQKSSASAVTFGFLCVAVRLWSCATTNLGPSASATDISAAVAGPRSFTSATFSAAPDTTRAPSGFEKPAALSASAPRISNTLPSTWKFLSSNPGMTARPRVTTSRASSASAADIARTASAATPTPANRCFQSPDWSCSTTSEPKSAVMRSASSSLDAGAPSLTSASADEAAAAPEDLAAAATDFGAPPAVAGRARAEANPGRDAAAVAGLAGLIATVDVDVALGLLTSTVASGAAFPGAPHASSTLAFLASSSASTCLAMDRHPPPARPTAARASMTAARTSGSLWSAHLTMAGTRVLWSAAAAVLSDSAAAAAIHAIVCAGTLGILCPSAATTSSATSARAKQCRENSKSASWFFCTTEAFLSLSLSSMPGSTSRASDRNSRRNPFASAPAAAHASPTHAMLASFVTTRLMARATSP